MGCAESRVRSVVQVAVGESTPRTLPELLVRQAFRHPRRAAVVAMSAYGGEAVQRLGYATLAEQAARVAGALTANGMAPGDRIVLLFDNRAGVEALTTLYGVHAARCVNVPVNARFTAEEIKVQIRHSQATLVIGTTELIDRLGTGDAVNCPLVSVGRRTASAVDWREYIADHGPLNAAPPEPDDFADWIYTSGTTGTPKCVMSTHRACLETGRTLAAAFDAQDGDVIHTPFPFYTSSGCHSSALSALAVGGTYVMEPTVDVAAIAHRIEKEQSSVFGAVPAVFSYLVESGWLERAELDNLRMMFTGGAAFPPHLLEKLLPLLPRHTRFANLYAQTESGNTGLMIDLSAEPARSGSVGRDGMPDVEHRVVDADGRPVHVDEVGEICLRGPAIMAGYFADQDATNDALRDGWLYTGDLAKVDADGYVYLFDRRKDIIIRGGTNISSLEVEVVLRAHPAVLDAAVVAVAHPHLGEDVRAFVVLRAGAEMSAAALAEHCRGRLADFKVPRHFTFRESLPHNATGKVQKALLRAEPLPAQTETPG